MSVVDDEPEYQNRELLVAYLEYVVHDLERVNVSSANFVKLAIAALCEEVSTVPADSD
jgi:hypothetical protein